MAGLEPPLEEFGFGLAYVTLSKNKISLEMKVYRCNFGLIILLKSVRFHLIPNTSSLFLVKLVLI